VYSIEDTEVEENLSAGQTGIKQKYTEDAPQSNKFGFIIWI
jgi:hypothetical protein